MNFMQPTKKCGLSPFFSEANTPAMENRHFRAETILCSGGGNFHSSHWYRFKKEMGDSDQPLWGLSLYVLFTTNNDVGQVLG